MLAHSVIALVIAAGAIKHEQRKIGVFKRVIRFVQKPRPVARVQELFPVFFKKQMLREYALVMGLEYNRISITGAKTRFGSCSSQKNICFSYRLMLYPEEAREYVIVHELAHLVEMNHSHRFYAIIERYMPDYKARRKLLKTSSEDSV